MKQERTARLKPPEAGLDMGMPDWDVKVPCSSQLGYPGCGQDRRVSLLALP